MNSSPNTNSDPTGETLSLPRQDLERLCALFAEAERETKRVEDLRDELATAAVNELRYAGYHITKALLATGDEQAEQILRAERHCQRAIYDAVDAGMTYVLEQVKQFQQDYSSLPIGQFIPNYPDLRRKVRHAKQLVDEARATGEDRDAFYVHARAAFEDLREVGDDLLDYREDLNRALDERREQVMQRERESRRVETAEARARRADKRTIIVAVATLVFTIIAAGAAVLAVPNLDEKLSYFRDSIRQPDAPDLHPLGEGAE